MERFYERPYLGWGFTSTAFSVYDQHVGNQNLLMTGGVIGYFVFILAILKIILIIQSYKKKYMQTNKDAKNLHLFTVGILALYIIHSSSTDLFSYLAPTFGDHAYKIVFLSVYLSLIMLTLNNFDNESKKNERVK
jgi:uncharacterized membrane protein